MADGITTATKLWMDKLASDEPRNAIIIVTLLCGEQLGIVFQCALYTPMVCGRSWKEQIIITTDYLLLLCANHHATTYCAECEL
jgi:hypothetical protein